MDLFEHKRQEFFSSATPLPVSISDNELALTRAWLAAENIGRFAPVQIPRVALLHPVESNFAETK
jgi:hypothetical protein